MMKWIALFLIVAGIASFAWAALQERTADLSNLPIVVIAGLGGGAMAAAGVFWMVIILIARSA
jgi:hypothetical protein